MSAFQEELLFRRPLETRWCMNFVLEFDGAHYTACYAASGRQEKHHGIFRGTIETPTTYEDHDRRYRIEGTNVRGLPRAVMGGALDIDGDVNESRVFVTHGGERSANYDQVFSLDERDGEIVFGACRGRDVFVVRKRCVAAAAA